MKTISQVAEKDFEGILEVFKDLFKKTHPQGTNGRLYETMVNEEYKEWLAEEPKTPNDFKELCDTIWCCIMYAIEQGYPLDKGMGELIREYMSKFTNEKGEYDPQYRDDGKLLKGKGFKKADFSKFV